MLDLEIPRSEHPPGEKPAQIRSRSPLQHRSCVVVSLQVLNSPPTVTFEGWERRREVAGPSSASVNLLL